MYEVKQSSKRGVITFSRLIVSANLLEVEAGTNGYRGGDGGHGSVTYFRIENAGGSSMDVRPNDNGDGFEVVMRGDCELSTVIEAFKFIIQVLEDGIEDYSDVS